MTFAKPALITALLLAMNGALAQSPVSTAGTLLVLPAMGEVTHANDQARVAFVAEEFDADKAAAADRVNRRMKEGTEIVRKSDPSARLTTRAYTTHAVYSEPRPGEKNAKPVQTGWRVIQTLEAKTTNLAALPATAAAAQKVLQINGINFDLTPATERRLDDARLAAAYQNLGERIASVARAMGREPSDAVLESIEYDRSANINAYTGELLHITGTRAASPSSEVAGPRFEPGESTLRSRVVGKIRFK